jgi:hypothetical protein
MGDERSANAVTSYGVDSNWYADSGATDHVTGELDKLAATYLINRLPTKILDFSSPLEWLFQEKPHYSGLRTFGCACWPNLRPFNTHKLQF